MGSAGPSVPVVTDALMQHCSNALEYFDSSRILLVDDRNGTSNRKLQTTINKERRRLLMFARLLDDDAGLTGNYDYRSRRIRNGPVPAILLDPLLPKLGPEQRADRLREILDATEQPTALQYYNRYLLALIGLGLPFLAAGLTALPPWVLLLPLLLTAAPFVPSKDRVHVRISDRGRSTLHVVLPGRWGALGLEEACLLATHMAHIGWDPTSISAGHNTAQHWLFDEPDETTHQRAQATLDSAADSFRTDSVSLSQPEDAGSSADAGIRRARATDVRTALTDLLNAWGAYSLDLEAWYFTKPLLHDVTGTVATTVAYQNALQDLIHAVDDLPVDAAQHRIDAVSVLADTAWTAWHDANDYAADVGLDDRSPSERAALRRLGNLVQRLTRSTASDPELPSIKREIQTCLDRITTVSVSWKDISALPAIEAAGVLPQLTATRQL